MRAKREILSELSFKELIDLSHTAAFSDDSKQQKEARELLAAYAAETKKNSPGFFTPYKNVSDFGYTVASPVVLPLTLGLMAGVAALSASLATITAAGSLFFAAGAGVTGLVNDNAKKMAREALIITGVAAIIAVASALITAALAVITAIATPLLIASIFTRGGASVVSAVADCFARCFPKAKAEDGLHVAPLERDLNADSDEHDLGLPSLFACN